MSFETLILPAVLVACVVMHFFMMRGHKHGEDHQEGEHMQDDNGEKPDQKKHSCCH